MVMDDEMGRIEFPKECSQQEEEIGTRSAHDEEHAAQTILSKKPKLSCIMGKLKERKEKSLKKKRQSSDKVNHVAAHLGGKCTGYKQNKSGIKRSVSPTGSKSPAMIRAEEVRSTLESAFPSFVKYLVRSHVSSCFWMGLPVLFCKAHLPNTDCALIVEDEVGKRHTMKYIAHKTGLSGGWRPFAVSHQLLQGDVLVFQLVEATKFKVYIIRVNDLTEMDGALGLLNLDVQTKPNDADMSAVTWKPLKKKRSRSMHSAAERKKKRTSCVPISACNVGQPKEQSGNDCEDIASDVFEGFKLCRQSLPHTDKDRLRSFRIYIDGIRMDHELSEDTRIKYYELCCSQKSFLHENFTIGCNFKLIIGAINETVHIADAIRTSKFTKCRDQLVRWDKILEAFELLGMNVGFLRSRMLQLINLSYGHKGVSKS